MNELIPKDLAVLYGVKAIRLREQVKRNIARFPEDFMFQLNDQEIDFMVSQNAIPSRKYLGGYNPYVFTEQGVAMLATVQVNIEIMRTFVRHRKMLASNAELARKLNSLEKKYDKQFKMVFDAIRELMRPPESKKRKIGFQREGEKG